MKRETTLKDFGAVMAIGVFLGTPADLLRAFVLTKLWAWFIAGYGLATPNLLQAYGLVVLLGFLKAKMPAADDEEATTHTLKLVVFSVLTSLTSWGLGAIVVLIRS